MKLYELSFARTMPLLPVVLPSGACMASRIGSSWYMHSDQGAVASGRPASFNTGFMFRGCLRVSVCPVCLSVCLIVGLSVSTFDCQSVYLSEYVCTRAPHS